MLENERQPIFIPTVNAFHNVFLCSYVRRLALGVYDIVYAVVLAILRLEDARHCVLRFRGNRGPRYHPRIVRPNELVYRSGLVRWRFVR